MSWRACRAHSACGGPPFCWAETERADITDTTRIVAMRMQAIISRPSHTKKSHTKTQAVWPCFARPVQAGSEPPNRPEFFTKILCLNLPCYHPLAVFLPRLGTHLHATFESGNELRSSQSSESELAGQQALLFRWC